MKNARLLHLYLGCVFAPMLVCFSITGILQLIVPQEQRPTWLQLLSTVHTARGLKTGELSTLSSAAMRWFCIAMAVSLILTMALGVFMAFRTGRKRHALAALALGVVAPVSLVLVTVMR